VKDHRGKHIENRQDETIAPQPFNPNHFDIHFEQPQWLLRANKPVLYPGVPGL
jgi:hypothetical protein